jgi:L-threonylcarbamoyladenylate synthase
VSELSVSAAAAVDLDAAVEILRAGGLVAFPTETVYGLGARADDDGAVAGIFATKGRPADHPLIVHLASVEQAAHFAGAWPETAARLAAAFWPGPLTLIVPRRAGVATAAAGGQDTIGLRCPSHPVAQALLRAALQVGVPGVAAPSANRFGRVSPTRAEHVRSEFGTGLAVLDGGASEVGIESAIVDCSGLQPALLRPGQLARARIEAVLGKVLATPGAASPKASGTLEQHYAPRARVRVLPTAQLQRALTAGPAVGDAARPGPEGGVAVYSSALSGDLVAAQGGNFRQMPKSADAVAHELFAVLRELDDAGAAEIWVEEPPVDDPAWEGVRDRLRRAAAAGG